jgi:3-deoxy-7-phosphoheptulonate synthase
VCTDFKKQTKNKKLKSETIIGTFKDMMIKQILGFFLLWRPVFSYMVWTHKAPIVFAAECDSLKTQLVEASHGSRFLFMTNLAFDAHTAKEPVQIRDNLRFLLQMSFLLRFSTGRTVVPLDTTYTQYLSDENKLRYNSHDDVVQCLNLVRGFFQGGMGDLSHFEDWKVVENKEYKQSHQQMVDCVRFIETFSPRQSLRMDDYFVGHASQVAQYEKHMTRNDSISNRTFACSSHFLWVEDLPNPLMIDHLSTVENPIGIVATDTTYPDLVLDAIEKLNPTNEHGKITIIVRMRMIKSKLPRLMDLVEKKKRNVLWCCDPTCRANLHQFLRIHQKRGSVAGGVWIKGRDLETVQFLSHFLRSTTEPTPRPSQWNRFSL